MMYLCEYKNRLNEMSSSNGHTCRVMYSPISRMISVHYFNLKKPLTSTSLLENLNYYRDSYVQSGIQEEIYSGLAAQDDEEEAVPELPISTPKVFLKRNLKRIRKAITDGSGMQSFSWLKAKDNFH